MFEKFGDAPFFIQRVEKEPTVYEVRLARSGALTVPAYDRAFNPPAPVADVTIANPVTSEINVPAFAARWITGADITVIPERLVVPLGISPRAAFGHAVTTVLTHNVQFIISGSPWKILSSRPYAVLQQTARDVLLGEMY